MKSNFDANKASSIAIFILVAMIFGGQILAQSVEENQDANSGKLITQTIESESDVNQNRNDKLVSIVGVDGKTIPVARGVWLAKGYGLVVEFTEDRAEFYQYTGDFGWSGGEESVGDLGLYFVLGKTNDEAKITEHAKEYGFRLVRLDQLPAACKREVVWTQTRLFDVFADVMTTYYPFFDLRNIDWQDRIKKHRAIVSDTMSDSELFDVMESMLLDLNDGHTELGGEFNGKERITNSGDPETVYRLRKSYAAQIEIKDFGEFTRSFINGVRKNILEKVLDGKGAKCCQNQIIWGLAGDDVGYINIQSMGGYAKGDTDENIKVLHASLNEILTKLADTKAIIIDISLNSGGKDFYGIEIASHFADRKKIAFSKWPATVKDTRIDLEVTPYQETDPDGVMYLKPVYVVTSDLTVSAAEVFTLCMRAMPQVKSVGKSTHGAFSDMLNKELPNEWSFTISNEVYIDHEGVCHEGSGISPSAEIEVFDQRNIVNAVHHVMIAKVLKLIHQENDK